MPEQIDANVKGLVDALNDLPGIFTFSSCGGHSGPLTASQVASGSFYIHFEVEIVRGGWRSLEIVAATIGADDDADKLTLTVWDDGGLCFELRGRDGGDPVALAVGLKEAAVLYGIVDVPEGEGD